METSEIIDVPCPISENSLAGWHLQLKRIEKRNCGLMTLRFLYNDSSKDRDNHNQINVFKSIRYSIKTSHLIRKNKTTKVLFPSFWLPNVLLFLILPSYAKKIIRISGQELFPGNPLSFLLRRYALKKAELIITLNRNHYDRALVLGVDKSKVVLIPNPVGPQFVPPTIYQRRAAREALNIESDEFTVGSIGALCERKQQKLIIEAVARSGIKNIKVILTGRDAVETAHRNQQSYGVACKQLASRLGVRLLLTGHREDVLPIFWALDVFVLPSLREGMPNALLEALGCGLTCIATDIPGNVDVRERGGDISLISTGDVKSLAEAIRDAEAISSKKSNVVADSLPIEFRNQANTIFVERILSL